MWAGGLEPIPGTELGTTGCQSIAVSKNKFLITNFYWAKQIWPTLCYGISTLNELPVDLGYSASFWSDVNVWFIHP